MGFADKLKAKGVTDFFFSDKPQKGAKKKSLKEKLIAQINNNLKLFDNPNFKVPGRNNSMKSPEPFFKIDGDKAQVWASYSKKKLTIDGTKAIVNVPAKDVKAALEVILEEAQAGTYDQQLDKIADERKLAQKQGGAKTKKAK